MRNDSIYLNRVARVRDFSSTIQSNKYALISVRLPLHAGYSPSPCVRRAVRYAGRSDPLITNWGSGDGRRND